MGVNEQLVILVGVDIKDRLEKMREEQYDELYEYHDITYETEKKKVGVAFDSMSEEYYFVGIPIFVSDRYDPINMKEKYYELQEPTEEQKDIIIKFIKEHSYIKEVDRNKIKTYVFMHYT